MKVLLLVPLEMTIYDFIPVEHDLLEPFVESSWSWIGEVLL